MVRHRGGLFERAAVLQIGRDPGRPEAVIAELGSDAGRRPTPADHCIGVRRRDRIVGDEVAIRRERRLVFGNGDQLDQDTRRSNQQATTKMIG
jgi:hypothetical protein